MTEMKEEKGWDGMRKEGRKEKEVAQNHLCKFEERTEFQRKHLQLHMHKLPVSKQVLECLL
jgi:hypothetical protein